MYHETSHLCRPASLLHRADALLVAPVAKLARGASIATPLHADAVVAALPKLGHVLPGLETTNGDIVVNNQRLQNPKLIPVRIYEKIQI